VWVSTSEAKSEALVLFLGRGDPRSWAGDRVPVIERFGGEEGEALVRYARDIVRELGALGTSMMDKSEIDAWIAYAARLHPELSDQALNALASVAAFSLR
jgi:hypothetical protein